MSNRHKQRWRTCRSCLIRLRKAKAARGVEELEGKIIALSRIVSNCCARLDHGASFVAHMMCSSMMTP